MKRAFLQIEFDLVFSLNLKRPKMSGAIGNQREMLPTGDQNHRQCACAVSHLWVNTCGSSGAGHDVHALRLLCHRRELLRSQADVVKRSTRAQVGLCAGAVLIGFSCSITRPVWQQKGCRWFVRCAV